MIVQMEERHLHDIIRLHEESLDKGLSSKMGHGFLKTLYRAMLPSQQCFTFVYERDSELIGFYTACEDTESFFREQIIKKGHVFIYPIFLRLIRNPLLLIKIFEATRYPRLASKNLEKAELLSLAVKDRYRGKGIGSEMLHHLVKEFKKRKIRGFKTSVRPVMKANEFYRKNGFVLADVIRFNGDEFNFYNYYIKD